MTRQIRTRRQPTLDTVFKNKRQQRQIIDLIYKGYTVRAISKKLHVSISLVQKHYWNAIAYEDEQIKQHASLLRTEQITQIDTMLSVISHRVNEGDLDAMDMKRRLLQDKAKLLSLYPKDSPQDQQVIVIGFPQPTPQLDDGTVIEGTSTEVENE